MGKGKKRKELSDGEASLPESVTVTTKAAKKEDKRLIIVLEGAHLESCKTGKEFSLLNIDDHKARNMSICSILKSEESDNA